MSTEVALELVVRTVVEEAQSASARCGVVDYFGYHRFVFAKVEFVADANFAGGFYQYVPEFVVGVEFAQQEYFDARAGFFLVAVEQGGEHLSVVQHHYISVAKVVEHVLENLVLNFTGFAVYNHEFTFVAVFNRILGDKFFGKIEFKL